MRPFDLPKQFESGLISTINALRNQQDPRKKDSSPTPLHFSNCTLLIARHFGFCFGVKNAIEKVYKIIDESPNKTIYLISEIIHNPDVNRDLKARGVNFIQHTDGSQLIPWSSINQEDIVVIPAFGTSLSVLNQIKEHGAGIKIIDTTCPFVEKVWNKGEKLAKEGYTIIIHGDFFHEETRATFSRISSFGKAVVVKNMNEAKTLTDFLSKENATDEWKSLFEWKASKKFDYKKHLQRVAVVNQTTMLADETTEIANYLKEKTLSHFGENTDVVRFADTRDTLCYATNDNQTAIKALATEKPDLAFVIGGSNSSNTTHLVEILEKRCKTFFVQNEKDIKSSNEINHFDLHNKMKVRSSLTIKKDDHHPTIAISSGASCPDIITEAVIFNLLKIFGNENELIKVTDQLKSQINNGL